MNIRYKVIMFNVILVMLLWFVTLFLTKRELLTKDNLYKAIVLIISISFIEVPASFILLLVVIKFTNDDLNYIITTAAIYNVGITSLTHAILNYKYYMYNKKIKYNLIFRDANNSDSLKQFIKSLINLLILSYSIFTLAYIFKNYIYLIFDKTSYFLRML